MFKYGILLFLIPFSIQSSDPSSPDLSQRDYLRLKNLNNNYEQLHHKMHTLRKQGPNLYATPEQMIHSSDQSIKEGKKKLLEETLASALFCTLSCCLLSHGVREQLIIKPAFATSCASCMYTMQIGYEMKESYKCKNTALTWQSVTQQIQAYSPQQLKEFKERSTQLGHPVSTAFSVDFLSKKME